MRDALGRFGMRKPRPRHSRADFLLGMSPSFPFSPAAVKRHGRLTGPCPGTRNHGKA